MCQPVEERGRHLGVAEHGGLRIPRNMGNDSTRSWARFPRHRGQPFHASGSLADVCMESVLARRVKRIQRGCALSHALTIEGQAVGVVDKPIKATASPFLMVLCKFALFGFSLWNVSWPADH